MWRGFCSSTKYFAMSSSDRARPNHVPYQVRNGTMMKSAATMISQMLDGRRVFGAGVTAIAAFSRLPFVEAIRTSRGFTRMRSEEHTSELQSQSNLVCRLLLEKKKKNNYHSETKKKKKQVKNK